MNFMAFHELTPAWDTAYSDSMEAVFGVYKNQKSDDKDRRYKWRWDTCIYEKTN